VDARGIPLGTVTATANLHDSPLLDEALDAVAETLGGLPEKTSVHLDRGCDSKAARERLEDVGCSPRSLRRAGPAWGHEALGGGADQLLASKASPQEACVVYGASRTGHQFPRGDGVGRFGLLRSGVCPVSAPVGRSRSGRSPQEPSSGRWDETGSEGTPRPTSVARGFGLDRFGQVTKLRVYRYLVLSLIASLLAYWRHLSQERASLPRWGAAARTILEELLA
jgi:hypothetical protein